MKTEKLKLNINTFPPSPPLLQAQGGMVNMSKRKPVGMAFHWFLPKVFGSDAGSSRLDPEDPMGYTRKPYESSPMFFDLAAPKRTYVKLPDDGTVEVRERLLFFFLLFFLTRKNCAI